MKLSLQTLQKVFFFLKLEKYKHLLYKTVKVHSIAQSFRLSPKYKVINLHLPDKNKK